MENYKNEILEIEVGPHGELDEKTARFVIEKCQEARDENIWYTQEEVIKALDELEEKNKKCIKSFILKEQK